MSHCQAPDCCRQPDRLTQKCRQSFILWEVQARAIFGNYDGQPTRSLAPAGPNLNSRGSPRSGDPWIRAGSSEPRRGSIRRVPAGTVEPLRGSRSVATTTGGAALLRRHPRLFKSGSSRSRKTRGHPIGNSIFNAAYRLNDFVKSSADTAMTFFCTFEPAMSSLSFFSKAELSIGRLTVWPSSDE